MSEAFFQLLAERNETAHLVQFFDSTHGDVPMSPRPGPKGSPGIRLSVAAPREGGGHFGRGRRVQSVPLGTVSPPG